MKQHPIYPELWITEDGRVFRELIPSRDSAGYAQIRNGKFRERRHTLVLETYHGLRPDGAVSRHKDGDPGNDHKNNLEWGTQYDNGQDTIRHGRTTRGIKNNQAKLTEEQAQEIKRRILSGENGRRLAKEFGISEITVSNIKLGVTWAWLRVRVVLDP